MKNWKRIICAALALVLSLSFVGCDGNGEESTDDIAASGKPDKRVAITFDDGPHNVRTRAIVDELAKYDFNATFFLVGNRVDGTEMNCAATVRYIIDNGNEVGIHGYTHDVYYNKCSDEEYKFELSETKKAITEAADGYKVSLMRPIGGAITKERVEDCEYAVIMWDVDSLDYEHRYSSSEDEGAEQKRDAIVENVMSQVKDGSIILMHDIYQSTVDATAVILKRLHEEGYDVVTVSQLIGDVEAGVKYFNAE